MNTLHIFDSVKKEKVEFKPIQERKVKIYVCGPTVYDDSHLGHARSAIAFDLLHRVLKANDYEVTMTKNFTDIDDKIIKKMYETKKTLEDITNQYINAYKADMKALNILDNTIEPKATENIEVMKEMISNLISKDVAYKTSDSVYFDTSKDNLYGTLSHKSNDENSQARVEENQEKRNSADFALWKFEKANDVSFDAPFGKGRPGWHIECSAMIEKHLAYKDSPYQIDIHAGGADLLFPHHENEAAQTRCSSGQNLAKYWMHNGFVNINGEKMSKSLGNSFFLKDVLKSYSGEVIRFYLMSTHYRADLSFNEEDLIASKKRLDKIYRLKKRVYGVEDSSVNKKFKEDILNALNDDINTSIALSVIDEMVNSANDKLDSNPKDKNLKKELISNINFIEEVLGIGGNDAYAYFQFGIDESTKEKIEDLILKRNEAKKAKDFQTADKLRDELSAIDISLMDTVNGTVWEKL
ncbi:cysteine--tRNA ligase [Aliarcobacter butzleri]|uniref:cysteine--tRNA ligase n=1 Tax=Aliarcobacter butzleri TaxID=28197 RepID=UPI0021B3D801|nr:cysteine--tRNA ligase [Aliarcobacter butzleri]MCT7565916.1 cysteine--tRNA ligase [Aliarcobacter butzleri]MCT7570172.1 cysteine--tRNA ligase [Aliarcobacter butzleri]MCT7612340.1 cysteine--tRNA ligase [Aliarcobacter butzleri]MCT7631916.1 cysteine--tRNA ligase [Aliarcobacter butzleri]MCT7640816.1 cysteine--tRNA ligase [Aliarcobacter butzleri]